MSIIIISTTPFIIITNFVVIVVIVIVIVVVVIVIAIAIATIL